MSEQEPMSQKGRSRCASPVTSAASKNAPSTKARNGKLASQVRPANPPRAALVPKEPVIQIYAATSKKMQPEPERPTTKDEDRLGSEPEAALLIPPHDIMKHEDIELALRYEAAQRAFLSTGGATEEQRFRNFKGDIKQVLQQTASMRAQKDRPPSGCPALYSRLSCHSGKAYADNLKRV